MSTLEMANRMLEKINELKELHEDLSGSSTILKVGSSVGDKPLVSLSTIGGQMNSDKFHQTECNLVRSFVDGIQNLIVDLEDALKEL